MLPDLAARAFDPGEPEWMDHPEADPRALAEDLAHLRTINRWFGGHAAARYAARMAEPGASLLDVACGSGDLTVLQKHALQAGHCVAVDRHPFTLAEAAKTHPDAGVEWREGDATKLPFADGSFDWVTCHLALHHFSGPEALVVLRELRRVARKGVVVADLERSAAAYAAVWLLVTLWLRAPMTRHDALLSVRRAFNRHELQALAREAGWSGFTWSRLPWHRQAICLRLDSE